MSIGLRFLGQSQLIDASRQSFSLRTGATHVSSPVPGINQATSGSAGRGLNFFGVFVAAALPGQPMG